MHYTVVVIFPADPETFLKIKDGFNRKDKYYVPKDNLDFISVFEKVDLNDTNNFILKLEEYLGKKAGKDEKGFYVMDSIFKAKAIEMYHQWLEKPFGKFDINRNQGDTLTVGLFLTCCRWIFL